jgi:hypothetical protein
VAPREQVRDQGGADEAGGARHEDHLVGPDERYIAVVDVHGR